MSDDKAAEFYEFYSKSLEALRSEGVKYGFMIPEPHLCMESGVMHIRMSVYAGDPSSRWLLDWDKYKQILSIPSVMTPGKKVIDSGGNVYFILGVDISNDRCPIRLKDTVGRELATSVENLKTFSVIYEK